MQWYTIPMMLLTFLGIIFMPTIKGRKFTLLRGQLFPNVVKVMLFVSDVLSCALVKLCKLIGKLTPGSVTLKRNGIWDT